MGLIEEVFQVSLASREVGGLYIDTPRLVSQFSVGFYLFSFLGVECFHRELKVWKWIHKST